MYLSKLIQKWSGINSSSRIVIITDDEQRKIADSIKTDNHYDVQIEYYSQSETFLEALDLLKKLREIDLLIVILSFRSYVELGANRYFSPFSKPDELVSKYIFMRLSISYQSLIEGLSTDKSLMYKKIIQMSNLTPDTPVRVTNASGTDISFKTYPFKTCLHEISENGGMAFLPPSETSSQVVTETANGKIVIDITVGQLFHYGTLLGYFGLVDSPVTLIVKDGIIIDIQGEDMAREVKEKLFSLPLDCRKIVELGQGLSKMNPTGLIGVDESIIDSCHFGFGDGGSCGTHWDVVISEPTIRQIKE